MTMNEVRTHDKSSVEHMYAAGRIAALALDEAERAIAENPYRKASEIDKICEDFIRSKGAIPECLGYHPPGHVPYEYATCVSRNDVACHGLPSDEEMQDGDIVNVDLVVRYNGWLGDTSRTFAIGNVSEDNLKLIQIAKNAMYAGMKVVQKGLEFRYIGSAIEAYCSSQKIRGKPVRPLPDYCGHGISNEMHEKPLVEHVRNHCRIQIKPYTYFTVEPIIVIGDNVKTYVCDDDWTIRTCSRSNAAQFEHTMGLDENGKLMIFTSRDREHEKQILDELYGVTTRA